MFKIKIAFLYKTSTGEYKWVSEWMDWNGIDDIQPHIDISIKQQEKILQQKDQFSKILYAFICESQPCDDGKYFCGSCEYYFGEPEDGNCPYCKSGNFTETPIDEPVTKNKLCYNCCPKCDATDIKWGEKEWFDTGAYQDATCNKCGCHFREYYSYSGTEIVN